MPAKYLLTNKKAQKQLKRLPVNIHRKAIKTLSILQANPLAGEKLHGELAGYYKFRIGDYRIVYRFDPKASRVVILKVEHRQGVYR